MNYIAAPDEIEKQWLERIFGKQEASRIIIDASLNYHAQGTIQIRMRFH